MAAKSLSNQIENNANMGFYVPNTIYIHLKRFTKIIAKYDKICFTFADGLYMPKRSVSV